MAKDRGKTSSNFRKPPVEYQFKKGRSGNPEGRPPKIKGGMADRFGAMALDEAMRPILVREGDKVSKLPALQALFRTMFRAAAQGDTRVGRLLLEVMARAESGRVEEKLEILEYFTRYKEEALKVIENVVAQGGEPPEEIYPHPDDIIFDEATGEVGIDGPLTKEQAGAREALRQQALQSMGRYFEVENALQKDPSNRALKQEFRKLKKYSDFLKQDGARTLRRKALRLSRYALQSKSAEPEHDNPDEAS